MLVLSGILNPAIFNPPWIAAALLGHAQGDAVTVGTGILPGAPPKPLHIIDQIGFSVTAERCELFLTSLEPPHLRSAEDLAIKIVETLPHTPWGAAGINFNYTASEEFERIDAISHTAEDFEQEYRIGSRVIRTEIILEPTRKLGVQREISEGEFQILFNDHHDDLRSDNAPALFKGKITDSLERARAIMEKYYDLTEEEIVTFPPLEQLGAVHA